MALSIEKQLIDTLKELNSSVANVGSSLAGITQQYETIRGKLNNVEINLQSTGNEMQNAPAIKTGLPPSTGISLGAKQ